MLCNYFEELNIFISIWFTKFLELRSIVRWLVIYSVKFLLSGSILTERIIPLTDKHLTVGRGSERIYVGKG